MDATPRRTERGEKRRGKGEDEAFGIGITVYWYFTLYRYRPISSSLLRLPVCFQALSKEYVKKKRVKQHPYKTDIKSPLISARFRPQLELIPISPTKTHFFSPTLALLGFPRGDENALCVLGNLGKSIFLQSSTGDDQAPHRLSLPALPTCSESLRDILSIHLVLLSCRPWLGQGIRIKGDSSLWR